MFRLKAGLQPDLEQSNYSFVRFRLPLSITEWSTASKAVTQERVFELAHRKAIRRGDCERSASNWTTPDFAQLCSPAADCAPRNTARSKSAHRTEPETP
jgi:hypothetical protein